MLVDDVKYIPLLVLIQLVNLVLLPIGWLVCLSPQLAKASWIFWNDDDGVNGRTTWWGQYCWLGWRNPVSNLRHIPGVSGVGRPLWLKSFTIRGKPYHIMAGWLGSTGYPVFQPLPTSGEW